MGEQQLVTPPDSPESSRGQEKPLPSKESQWLSDFSAVFAVGCLAIGLGWMGLTILGKVLPLAKLGIFIMLLWTGFLLIGFPIWAIVHCVKSKHLSVGHKVVWVLTSVLLWGVGPALYGFLASRSRGFSGDRLHALVKAVFLLIQ